MPDTSAPSDNLTLAHALGEILFLLVQSNTHRHFAIGDLEWMVLPAVGLQQFRLFRGPDGPIGVVFWGYLSEEAEQRLDAPRPRLRPDDWKSGNRLWIVEVVAPTNSSENQLIPRMLTELSQTALAGQDIRFHRIDPATGRREAITVTPEMLQAGV